MEHLKYIMFYNQIEKVFSQLEQIKAKFSRAYEPAGV